ncbi:MULTISPECIES: CoA pyrophosphatase [Giesbergeria]|uniref:CoA pyrophosphatase n=1 Tax=Giesbergeria sinuosa TaxID=80883 RepID=A0ABV9QBL5_9BURK
MTAFSSTPSRSRLPSFDPQQVPVLGIDSHLPPVPALAQTPEALRQRFAQPPLHWQPEVLYEPAFSERSQAAAAVLVPIVLREQPTVLLTERSMHLSSHSGQVAFPGGRVDPEDASVTAAALREAEEEIGLEPHWVEVIGTLPTYVTGSAYVVAPVVALVQPQCTLHANPHEVADIFEVPLAFLMNPANHRRHAFEWQGVRREWFSMPYQHGEKTHYIWGATAGMLRNFYRFLQA